MRIALLCLLCLFALPAYAQSEARAVALQNNCKPTKIEVLQLYVGPVGETTYTVTCLNKVAGASESAPKTLTLRCRNRQCVVLN